jgi:hypothetical protein
MRILPKYFLPTLAQNDRLLLFAFTRVHSRLVLFPLFAFVCSLSAIAVLNHGTCCFDWRWRIHSRLPSSFICVRSRFEAVQCPDSSCSCY